MSKMVSVGSSHALFSSAPVGDCALILQYPEPS